MIHEKHDLLHELPEHKEAIHALVEKNAHFARMFEEYNDINRKILRIETSVDPRSDQYLEDKKKRRLLLKDQLYEMIQAI